MRCAQVVHRIHEGVAEVFLGWYVKGELGEAEIQASRELRTKAGVWGGALEASLGFVENPFSPSGFLRARVGFGLRTQLPGGEGFGLLGGLHLRLPPGPRPLWPAARGLCDPPQWGHVVPGLGRL